MTRRSFAWLARLNSPTSSRKSVPPSAARAKPVESRIAPVKAPRTCPNIWLSKSVSPRAAQSTARNGAYRSAGTGVNVPRNNFFSGAGGTEDQDGAVAARCCSPPHAPPSRRPNRQSVLARMFAASSLSPRSLRYADLFALIGSTLKLDERFSVRQITRAREIRAIGMNLHKRNSGPTEPSYSSGETSNFLENGSICRNR